MLHGGNPVQHKLYMEIEEGKQVLRYIAKRILMMLPILFGITVIVFTLMYITPGDPAYAILGENATPEQVMEIHKEYGLDDPYLIRLGRYFCRCPSGGFRDFL